jgi:hypothetical protein
MALRWLVVLCLASASALAQRQSVTIGVVLDGPGDRSIKGFELIRQEITSLLSGEYDIRFPPEKQLDGNWSGSGVRAALDQLLADPEVDVVLAAAAVGSIDAARRGPLPKPVLTTAMLLPRVLGLPYEERVRPVSGREVPERYHVSGVPNLSYTVFSTDFVRELSAFREVVPFSRLTVLSMDHMREVIPDIEQIFNRQVERLDLQITHVTLRDSVPDLLARIPTDTEAVYVTPLPSALGSAPCLPASVPSMCQPWGRRRS